MTEHIWHEDQVPYAKLPMMCVHSEENKSYDLYPDYSLEETFMIANDMGVDITVMSDQWWGLRGEFRFYYPGLGKRHEQRLYIECDSLKHGVGALAKYADDKYFELVGKRQEHRFE